MTNMGQAASTGSPPVALGDIDLCDVEGVIGSQHNACDDSGVFGCPAPAEIFFYTQRHEFGSLRWWIFFWSSVTKHAWNSG